MSDIKRKDGYCIQVEWMIDDLGLSGNHLIAYSIVYSFSRDGVSAFRGGLPYIMKWCGCSKNTARKILSDLVDGGLITRENEMVKGSVYPAYQAVIGGLQKLEGGTPEIGGEDSKNCRGPLQKLEAGNINKNIKEKRERFTPPTLDEVKAFFSDKGLESDPLSFWMHFSNTGWRLSGGKGSVMKSWQMAAFQWERRKDNFGGK